MPALCFSAPDGAWCELKLAEPALPAAIAAQLAKVQQVWFECQHMALDPAETDVPNPAVQPLFFEWQRLDWLFELGPRDADAQAKQAPLALYVNGNLEPGVTCRHAHGRVRLSGASNLANAVGKTRFEVRDALGKVLFSLGVEVFPQKLDYKEDFPAMLAEVTEVVHTLAFDLFKKTYASAKAQATYTQQLSEWLNIYRALAESFERSIDTLMRAPKSELRAEQRLVQVERVKRVSVPAISRALRQPQRHCRGGGLDVGVGRLVSHLPEQHKRISHDTRENRFVLWAIQDVQRKLDEVKAALQARLAKLGDKVSQAEVARTRHETEVLAQYQRKLRFRLNDPMWAEVGRFDARMQFSTTLTMAPGYKEFYHRYLLLRQGLFLADDGLFNMDYKDIATLYEYWCFLKTVKTLRDNPKYDLVSSDVVKVQHHRFTVSLQKGKKSEVRFKQRATGDDIALYYNRSFKRDSHTYTFDQEPDNFIEFSRAGYGHGKDKRTFKVVLDAKYRFDRGSSQYPKASQDYGPPLDAIAQLHRYRDAILWQQGTDDSVKVANKSLGGVILFPYPEPEQSFVGHPFYKSIAQVNIGAIPLLPGRPNVLYAQYLDSLFERSGEALHQSHFHEDTRPYEAKRQAMRDGVMVGLVPRNNREARWQYHLGAKCFYTEWTKHRDFPLEKIKAVALYDQASGTIQATAEVESIEFMLGSELQSTGTSWPPRKPGALHCVYKLKDIHTAKLACSDKMFGQYGGRFMVSRLGLNLALEHADANLLYVHTWDQYLHWQDLRAKGVQVKTRRKPMINEQGEDDSQVEFEPVVHKE
jgi:predicted component of viral defense system (DUF524 family)